MLIAGLFYALIYKANSSKLEYPSLKNIYVVLSILPSGHFSKIALLLNFRNLSILKFASLIAYSDCGYLPSLNVLMTINLSTVSLPNMF